MPAGLLHLPNDVIHRLKDPEDDGKKFIRFVASKFLSEADFAGVTISILESNLIEARIQWLRDLKRISSLELDGGTPDHFKHAGHLAYWLRRSRAVAEVKINESYPPAGTEEDVALIKEYQNFLLRYPNEYLAFTFGFAICLLYEITPTHGIEEYLPNLDFIQTMCQFLWNKNVSPHAMFVIYKSLFLRPWS